MKERWLKRPDRLYRCDKRQLGAFAMHPFEKHTTVRVPGVKRLKAHEELWN